MCQLNSPSIHAGFRAFNWNRHHSYKRTYTRFLERPDKRESIIIIIFGISLWCWSLVIIIFGIAFKVESLVIIIFGIAFKVESLVIIIFGIAFKVEPMVIIIFGIALW